MRERFVDKTFRPATRRMIDKANDIIAEYQRDGYTLTLRQLYYQFVARGEIENTERSYKRLGSIITDGRLAGLVDWESIEDRGRGVLSWLINEDETEAHAEALRASIEEKYPGRGPWSRERHERENPRRSRGWLV